VALTLNTLARANLELPLGGHDLGVGARDLDAGVQAGAEVGLDNVALDDTAGANTAVVRTLRSRVAVLGPAVRAAVEVEESVLLLETEPGLVLGVGLHQLGRLVAVVVLIRGAIGIPALAENKDVGVEAERIGEDSNGLEVNVRVVAGGLASRRAIKVPQREVLGLVVLLGESLIRGFVSANEFYLKGGGWRKSWHVPSTWTSWRPPSQSRCTRR
jgi:hypothetical protein